MSSFKPLAAFLALVALVCSAAHAASARNIAVFGDSLADGVWAGLHQEGKAAPEDRLFRDSKVGTGLTKPDFDTFFDGFVQTLDRDHVTDVIVMFGANDEESLRDENHKGYLFQSPGWVRVYQARIVKVIEAARKHEARVFWIGLPVLRDQTLDKGAQFLNGILKDTAEKNGAVFIPLAEDFRGSDGSFASHLPDAQGNLHEVRLTDGVHFTFYGYDLIAKKVYKGLGAPAAGTAKPAP